MTAVEVGAEFDNYDELTNAIKAYEAENFVNLIIRDTRKVEAAAKRNQRKNYNPEIKYSDISYCCTYGGKKYISHSTGKRNHTSTKQACPFSLKVRATVDGQRLFVREMCSAHNHEISEAEFRLHPKQRKLDMGSQEEIANLLSMEPDKKLLRDKLMQITGKVILMKDIHNIKTRLLNRKSKPSDGKSDSFDKMEHSEGNLSDLVNLSDTQVTVETQTHEEQQPQEIRIPISHVAPPHLDSTQHTLMVQQPAQQQLDNVQQCYVETQAYQQQPSNVYTVNVQSFQPSQVYSIGSQPFQQASPIMVANNAVHSVPQMDPNIGGSQHFQQWTTLEDMGRQTMQESNYPTITTLSFPDQPNETHLANQQQPQQQHHQHVEHHTIQIASSEPMHPVLLENPNIPPNNVQSHESQPLLMAKRGRKKRTTPPNGERKRKKSAVQADKDNLMKKYFQQATVNLFFNERLKSPGSKLLKTARSTPVIAKMSQNPSDGKFHDYLKPLSWLFGKWRSESGQGIYPTLEDFTYGEEMEFEPVGMKPIVEYRCHSFKPDNNVPLHIETGFIRIKPDSNHIAFMAAHNLGVVEIQEGEVHGQELTVETASIGRTSFNKSPAVKMVKRTIKRKDNELEQVMYMETANTAMTEHLRITLKKME